MSEHFTLITGRTIKQADGKHKGKDSDAYRRSTALVEMNEEDMVHLGIVEGQTVRLRTEAGQVEVTVHKRRLPAGVVFVPVGPAANLLIGPETGGTGMPSFKGLAVEIELA